MTVARVVHVAVAVIFDAAGRVLVAQRLPHQHLAGLWEFPGGKLEPGETLVDGMRREIREELGIHVEAVAPLLRIEHAYPEKTVLLDVWRIARWTGESPGVVGAEGQPLRWVHPDAMNPAEFPPADVPIIAALRLPAHYVISPDLVDAVGVRDFIAQLVVAKLASATFACGSASPAPVRLVQVRLKTVPLLAPTLIAGLRQALPVARILLNSDTLAALPADAAKYGVDGLHLTSHALRTCTGKPATTIPGALYGASCHDAEDLARAFSLGIDFATLSPVLSTPSHIDASPMGWNRFAQLAAGAGLPVYALGGMRASCLDDALAYGAIGIAGISSILD